MEEPDLSVVISLWRNQNEELSTSSPSSSRPSFVPQLKRLDDMVYEVYSPPHLETPEFEVVFFHGLLLKYDIETYFETWMSRDNSQFWLQTWLVQEFPGARILIVSYDSSATKTGTQGRMDMHVIAENLLGSLTSDTVNVGQSRRPVVLVGHCVGGLVMKELCLMAEASLSGMNLVDLLSSLRGMFFYGTPHSGSTMVDQLHDYIRVEGPLLEEMEKLKASCARRNEAFQNLRNRHHWWTRGVGEGLDTFVEFIGEYIRVVPEASARPYMDDFRTDPHADHYDVCKPAGPCSSSFKFLARFLREIQAVELRRPRVLRYTKAGGEYVVDMEGRAKHVCEMLKTSHTVFINGVGGIGKTTLAEQVCNLMSHTFKFTAIISLEDSDGREQLRRKLREWLEEVDIRLRYMSTWDEIEYLKGRTAGVLVVVDNVKSQDQLKFFDRGDWSWPGDGSNSRLIVTTTTTLLCPPSTTYKVPYLSDKESRNLFLHCTFNSSIIEPTDLTPIVERVIKQCDKFPLPLKVLGSFISRQGDVHDLQFWTDIAKRQSTGEEVASGNDPEHKLLTRLRPAYDSLGREDKEVLLDAAMLFHGIPFLLVELIWKAAWKTATLAWINLKNASLVSLDSGGRIWIHEQVRSFCMSIACPRGTDVHKWTRISNLLDAKDLIACSESQGTISTQALRLEAMKNERIGLKCSTFGGYSQLKYLILKGVDVIGRTDNKLESTGNLDLPRSLVYLSWSDGLFETCPVDFTKLPNLVALELRGCKNMKTFPCSLLRPKFEILLQLPNKVLKRLDLEGCESLTELPDAVSHLRLEYLGLTNTKLKVDNVSCPLRYLHASGSLSSEIPKSSTKLVRTIDLSRTRVTELPDSIGRLGSLTSLKLDGTELSSLPESVRLLTKLKVLHLMETKVKNLPTKFCQLRALEYLNLKNTPLEELPESFERLKSLKHLQLSGTNICKLPSNFGALEKLEYLDLSNTGVTELGDTFSKLSLLNTFLKAHTSSNTYPHMPMASLERLCALPNLQVLSLPTDCLLTDSEGLGDEEHRDRIRGGVLCPQYSQSSIPTNSISSLLPRLATVQSLSFHDNCNLEFPYPSLFHALRQMPSLRSLLLRGFDNIVHLPDELGSLTQLEALHLVAWKKLEDLPESAGSLSLMIRLELRNLPCFRKLPESLGTLAVLSDLIILQCGRLVNLPSSFGHLIAEKDVLEEDSAASSAAEDGASIVTRKVHNPVKIYTDSWDILHCCLECCQDKIIDGVSYSLNCREMNELGMPPADRPFPFWSYDKDSVDRLGVAYLHRRREANLPLDVIHRPGSRPNHVGDGDDNYYYDTDLFDSQRPRIHIGCHSHEDEGVDWKVECPHHPSFDVV